MARISGSHHVMQHPDGRTVPVPVHVGQDMPKGTLRNILAIMGMTADEFRALRSCHVVFVASPGGDGHGQGTRAYALGRTGRLKGMIEEEDDR